MSLGKDMISGGRVVLAIVVFGEGMRRATRVCSTAESLFTWSSSANPLSGYVAVIRFSCFTSRLAFSIWGRHRLSSLKTKPHFCDMVGFGQGLKRLDMARLTVQIGVEDSGRRGNKSPLQYRLIEPSQGLIALTTRIDSRGREAP